MRSHTMRLRNIISGTIGARLHLRLVIARELVSGVLTIVMHHRILAMTGVLGVPQCGAVIHCGRVFFAIARYGRCHVK